MTIVALHTIALQFHIKFGFALLFRKYNYNSIEMYAVTGNLCFYTKFLLEIYKFISKEWLLQKFAFKTNRDSFSLTRQFQNSYWVLLVLPRYRVTTTIGSRVGSLNPSWNEENPNPEVSYHKFTYCSQKLLLISPNLFLTLYGFSGDFKT